jgi:hypothetical protein
VRKRTGLYPRLHVATAASGSVGQGGGVVLIETIRASRIDGGLSTTLGPWCKALAVAARLARRRRFARRSNDARM